MFRNLDFCLIIVADILYCIAILTCYLFDFCQCIFCHILKVNIIQMIFDIVDKIRKQSKLKVSRPIYLFLFQIILTAQTKMLVVKPLVDFIHRNTMCSVILLCNGKVNFSSFIPSYIFHELFNFAFEVTENWDVFFGYLCYCLS